MWRIYFMTGKVLTKQWLIIHFMTGKVLTKQWLIRQQSEWESGCCLTSICQLYHGESKLDEMMNADLFRVHQTNKAFYPFMITTPPPIKKKSISSCCYHFTYKSGKKKCLHYIISCLLLYIFCVSFFFLFFIFH